MLEAHGLAEELVVVGQRHRKARGQLRDGAVHAVRCDHDVVGLVEALADAVDLVREVLVVQVEIDLPVEALGVRGLARVPRRVAVHAHRNVVVPRRLHGQDRRPPGHWRALELEPQVVLAPRLEHRGRHLHKGVGLLRICADGQVQQGLAFGDHTSQSTVLIGEARRGDPGTDSGWLAVPGGIRQVRQQHPVHGDRFLAWDDYASWLQPLVFRDRVRVVSEIQARGWQHVEVRPQLRSGNRGQGEGTRDVVIDPAAASDTRVWPSVDPRHHEAPDERPAQNQRGRAHRQRRAPELLQPLPPGARTAGALPRPVVVGDQPPGHKQYEHGVDRQEVPHGLDPHAALIQEDERDPGPWQEVPQVAPNQADACSHPRHRGCDPQHRAHAVHYDVAPGEPVCHSVPPLVVGRPVHAVSRNHVSHARHVLGPPGIRQQQRLQSVGYQALQHEPPVRCPRAPLPRPAGADPHVGLRHPQRQESRDAQQHSIEPDPQPVARQPRTAPILSDEERKETDEGNGPRRELAGQCEAHRQPAEDDVLAPPSLQHAGSGKEEQQDERIGRRVHGEEVRLLNQEGCTGRKRGCEQAHAPVVEPPAEQEQEHDGYEVEDSHQLAPDKVHVTVGKLVQTTGDDEDQVDRQSAVHEELVPGVARVQPRLGGVEVLAQVCGHRERGLDHCQESLVGMQVMPLVPVDTQEPEIGPHSKDDHQGQDHDQRRDDSMLTPRLGGWLLGSSRLGRRLGV